MKARKPATTIGKRGGGEWTPEDFREFWAGFEHDEAGNVVLRDPMPDELLDATVDPEIQAIIDRFRNARRAEGG